MIDADTTSRDSERVTPVVQLRAVSRHYGERTVLDRVDLDIGPGEFIALIGRSGSGKSTLLRSMARLDEDVAGSGTVGVPENRSVLFQDSRLLPWQRVLANVTLGLRGPDARASGLAALADVGLAGRERAWPNALSGGEQQRVALARALVGEPDLLLADEPFGALDALTRLRMHRLLLRLVAEHRPAVLLVTHDVDEALALADRVLVIDSGVLLHDQPIPGGQPRDRADPALPRVRADLLEALGVTDDS
ncbi:ABC transporter ATP-binding protein [Tamaricihabitans halophyticus]|nr:ABC transporter ATP-binding protein [Tamaricihabitans halophyticus]